jgi:hypothetical protein
MKRLILFIGFIALTSALFAQTWQPSLFGYIQSYPQYELVQHNHPHVVNVIRNTDTTDAQYQNYLKYLTGDHFYSFFQDEKLYMLSYDVCVTCYTEPSVKKDITRGLYLFRLDANGWSKACYEPVQIDHFGLDSSIDEPNVQQHNIWSSYTYVPNRKYLNNVGSVTVSTDGEVTIVLINRKWRYNDKYTETESFENKTVTLVRNDGELYTIKK